jgi:DNA polymerase-3 subunit delta'
MWKTYGQDHLLAQLEASLRKGRPAHAYLLVGPPHVGKMTLAINLAQAVNCLEGMGTPCGNCTQCTRIAQRQHADLRIVALNMADAEGANRTLIGIDDIRTAMRQVFLNPYEGSFNVVIIDTAESMSEEAANALLKTLEEPPPQVLMLLLTADEEALLPTIRSRCHRLQLLPLRKSQMVDKLVNEFQAPPQDAEKLARLSRGCFGWAISALEEEDVLENAILKQRDEDLDRLDQACQSGLDLRFTIANVMATLFYQDREATKQSLYQWLRWWRDLLLIKEGGEEYIHNTDRSEQLTLQATGLTTVQIVVFIKRVLETLEALDRNASARLALEVLMLDLPSAETRT